jgi:hypothetical protein
MSVLYAAGGSVTPAVEKAIADLRSVFSGKPIEATADGSGGAFIVVDGIDLCELYAQDSTWLGFHITYLHPASDVYPHYVRPDLSRRDGAPLGPGFAPTTWVHGQRPAMQLSRRSNRWDPRRDTPALKALKVLAWMSDTS